MKAQSKHSDFDPFDDLVPLSGTNDAARAHIARRMRVEIRGEDTVLFKRGDAARCSIYLLEGEVVLSSPLTPEERLRAGGEAARYPLAHHFPRHVTARALTRTKLLIIDGDVAELIDGVPEPAEQTDWKTAWLKSPLFQRLPRPHLDDLLERMEEIVVQAGQVIIHQDEMADCYYVIKKGRCSVSRRPAPRARDVKLAELTTGQGFGEEALITNATRNASITMMEDGVLLRLGKEDFINSLAKPLLRHVPFDELTSHGNAVLVDVRTPEEFETDGLLGSLNMPMPVLRLKAHRLDSRRVYVVYSNTGHFSTAAAFILLQHGLDAYVLKGGVSGAPRHRIKHPRSYRQEDGRPEQGAHTVVPFPDAAGHGAAAGEDAVRFDWVADEAMWRNTIGLREDRQIESLLTPSAMYRNQAADTSHQGFEDVRLFTKVGGGVDARLSITEEEASHDFVHRRRNGDASQVRQDDQFTFVPHRARAEARSIHAQSRTDTSPGLSKGGIAVLILLMISVGLAAAFWTNDNLRNAMSQVPEWVQKQRDLEAKVTRLLENMERLPALQSLRPAPAPTPDPRNSGEIVRAP